VQYQPIVELETGKTVKAEALIRWRHPLEGVISPGVFIPLAEEVGLIHPISKWTFYRALSEFKQLFRLNCCQLSINVSSVQFSSDSDFADTVLRVLDELQIDPGSLVLELTESVLLELDAQKEERFRRIREAGIGLALDDFGTGFSSLAYINRLQFDYLKIDRVFTHDLETNPTAVALCEAMISMAQKLGMQVIAEGIENRYQHDRLLKAGCALGQGLLFSPAVDLQDFKRGHCTPACCPPRTT
jgi:EAL domain-containing protein (putative c-di-GMP-specific phosphodiesterase class I)